MSLPRRPREWTLFRSCDLSGGAKALWFLFVLIFPLIGVIVYLVIRGGSMHHRSIWQFQPGNSAPAVISRPQLRTRRRAQQTNWRS
jgi:ABC-type Fe3+ transport system permease subunit